LDVPQRPADVDVAVRAHRTPRSVAALLSKTALVATVVLDFIGAGSQDPNVQGYVFGAVFFTVIAGIAAGLAAGRAARGFLLAGANLALGLLSLVVFVLATIDNMQ
jgi:hypothetical protein